MHTKSIIEKSNLKYFIKLSYINRLTEKEMIFLNIVLNKKWAPNSYINHSFKNFTILSLFIILQFQKTFSEIYAHHVLAPVTDKHFMHS